MRNDSPLNLLGNGRGALILFLYFTIHGASLSAQEQKKSFDPPSRTQNHPSILNLPSEILEGDSEKENSREQRKEILPETFQDKAHYKIYTPPEPGRMLLLVIGTIMLLISYARAWSNLTQKQE